MSAAAPPPPPPPPPPSAESNPSEPKSEKNRTKLLQRHRFSGHSGPPQSSKVAIPAQEPTKKSFIWPWLEGKLEKKPSSFSGEGSYSSSSRFSDSVPVLAPMPVSAVAPQGESNKLGLLADSATELMAVYDPFYKLWYYMSLNAYNAIFLGKKEEKLPDEDKKVEENVKEENIEEKEVQVDLPKQMTPKVKTIQIGEIEVEVPLQNSGKLNHTASASSSSNIRDGDVKEEADELPTVVEHGQQSGTPGQKKGKKKKNNKGKKK